MFSAVFGFSGRIKRLQYFLSIMALGLVVGILTVIAIVTAITGRGGAPLPTTPIEVLALLAPVVVFLLPVFAAYLWISLSLQARRFRDIGWNPLYAILGWIGVLALDKLLAMAVPSLAVGHGEAHILGGTILGGLVNLAMGGALLFWPSASVTGPTASTDDGETPAPIRGPRISRVARPEPVLAETPEPQPRAPWPTPAAPSGPPVFGRRSSALR